ncbi:MAG TPA: phytanoyl-CoA dioxygenase family protein [Acidimicrobiales bacterium]|nr:phytanoyl-CoA dioxygenase family protein [Acidimicrobiales bacterium]
MTLAPAAPAVEATVRETFERDGSVLLRGLVEPDEAAAVRRDVTAVLVRHGWAAAGSAAAHGPRPVRSGWNPLAPAAPDRSAYREICALESLHRLGDEPALTATVAGLLGGADVFRHPRPVPRVVAPAAGSAQTPTPPHQDHVNMQGTRRAVVAWVALSACPRWAGPLEVALGSHREGPRPHSLVPGSGVLACPVADRDKWWSEDLEPGDVILFDALSVHRALPNRSGAFRLSVDFRYQRRRDPVCSLTLGAYGDLGWDEIYAGWRAPVGPGPFYWRDVGLRVEPHDPAYCRADRA